MKKTACDVQRARVILGKKTDGAVYMAVQRRQIPFKKVGKALIFFEEDLYEFLEGQPGVSVEEALGAK